MSRVGVVVIGHNEGERLRRCLVSVVGIRTMYVDSASTDGSAALACSLGVEVIDLDASHSFTAARARNAGAARLLAGDPGIELIQFVDGDCELMPGWIERAAAEFDRDASLAVVCGRRRERDRTVSIYHRLCDLEWDTPIGEAAYCGGDAMIRAAAFRSVGGYRAAMNAGEEPELCVRLRARGSKILRIDAEMTRHDAHLTRFCQWWRRATRAGYAFAQGAAIHGTAPARHWVSESRSIWWWGLALPVATAGAVLGFGNWSACLLLAYPALATRIFSRLRRRGVTATDAALYALFCVLGKFPQALGQLRFQLDRWWRPHSLMTGALGEGRLSS